MEPVNIILDPLKAKEEVVEKKEKSPMEEALEILARYEEGTPPRKFGYED